jgi:hypothetical protein
MVSTAVHGWLLRHFLSPNETGFTHVESTPHLKFIAARLAGMMIPSIGEQDTADTGKQRRDRDRSFHLASVNSVCHL